MSAFEFFFTFFGLVLGLSVTVIAGGLSDVLRSRQVVPIGWLTPLLAMLVLVDISTFWITAWTSLQGIEITYASIFGGLTVALVYYLAASMVFPRNAAEWPSLDVYYDGHKRLVIGGVLFSNLLGLLSRIATGAPVAGSVTSIVLLTLFFGLLIALLFVRSRPANIALLILHCVVNLAPAFLPT